VGSDVFVRQQARGGANLATLRSRVLEFNSALVVHHSEDLEKTVADSISNKRFTMTRLGAFALLALLLASIGIYGVLSYLVGQRTKEIGVRMALGARKFDVLRMVLKDGARMTLIGIILSVVGALGLTRLLRTMLYGVKPTDPLTFLSVAALLGGHSNARLLHSSAPRDESGSLGSSAASVGTVPILSAPDKMVFRPLFSRRGEVREWLKRSASKAGEKLQRQRN
jgi:ABC-type antimicrobial peptide transport system permease subunit